MQAAPSPQQHMHEQASTKDTAAAAANEKDFQRMTLQEVRVILRQKGLNVGGSKDVLIARYFDALETGDVKAHSVRTLAPLLRTPPQSAAVPWW
jgi:hypothetical protein